MKLACHTIAFHSLPLPDAIRKIAEVGYEGIELNAETNWARPHVTPDTPSSERREFSRLIASSGLSVSSICAHASLIEADRGRRDEAVRYMRGCIEMAAEFETTTVHAISGPLGPGQNRSEAMRLLANEILGLLDHARANGTRLAVEAAVNQLVCDSTTLRELLGIVDEADSNDRLFVNFDPSHYVLYGENPAKVVETLGGRIIHVHAKDSRGNPANFSFPPLGRGIIDFREFVKSLRKVGYDGFVSVEYEGEIFGYERDAVEATKTAKAFLSNVLAAD